MTTYLNIPKDIDLIIKVDFSAEDLCRTSTVNKRWAQNNAENYLWKKCLQDRFPTYVPSKERSYKDQFKSLWIEFYKDVPRKLMDAFGGVNHFCSFPILDLRNRQEFQEGYKMIDPKSQGKNVPIMLFVNNLNSQDVNASIAIGRDILNRAFVALKLKAQLSNGIEKRVIFVSQSLNHSKWLWIDIASIEFRFELESGELFETVRQIF